MRSSSRATVELEGWREKIELSVVPMASVKSMTALEPSSSSLAYMGRGKWTVNVDLNNNGFTYTYLSDDIIFKESFLEYLKCKSFLVKLWGIVIVV